MAGWHEPMVCLRRVPYATLIATIMCCVGVGIFCGTMYRGVTLTLLMIRDVFYFDVPWLDAVQLIFIIIGAIMGSLGLLLLLVGFLATGSTREKVYKQWRARLGGRISCAVLMVITYILNLIWLNMFVCLTVVTLGYSLAWMLCSNRTPYPDNSDNRCINLTQFNFLFPNGTHPDLMNVCGTGRLKLFCKDYVEPAGVMFVLASLSALLVILSLVHYLTCLSANYAHIKDNEKFQDLQEMQYLQEHDTGTLPKERF